MLPSVLSRIVSVLSPTEIDDLASSLSEFSIDKESATSAGKEQGKNQGVRSTIAFACRAKRFDLKLSEFAVAKSSGILPSELRSIEDGDDYDLDSLSKLLDFLGLRLTVIDADA